MWMQACRKIVAIGRNFKDHAKELNNPVPSKPILFLKPPSSLLYAGKRQPIVLAQNIGAVHHEVELAVVMGVDTRHDTKVDDIMSHVAGYALAIDLTARDIQQAAKEKGLPWTEAKGYDTFCPISELLSRAVIPDPADVELRLHINGEERQRGNTKDMIFSVPELIGHVSQIMALEAGDIILTGTPAGVGPVNVGDHVVASIPGIVDIEYDVEERKD
jgi:acylpyruvate hydrolase